MNFRQQPLTDQQLLDRAPSIFAGQPHHEVSERYTFVPTTEVINGMRQAGFFPVEASQSITTIPGKQNFTKHMIRFRSQYQLANLNDLALDSVLINSHDCSSAYTMHCGILRFACMNGLIVSEGTIVAIRVRHTGNILDAILEANQQILEQAPKVLDTINHWQNIFLTEAEQIAFAQSAHILRFDESTKLAQDITPASLLTAQRSADQGNSLWKVFNRVQENTVKGGKVRVGYELARNGHRRIRTVSGIDQSTKLNKALWTLAEKMAELKG